MRTLLTIAALLAAVIVAGGDAHAQATGVQVSPILIDIPAERGVASFRLRNGRDTEVSFEIDVYAWSQDNGDMVLTPTTDLVVAPSVFLVAPEREQIVRLGAVPAARTGGAERAYRIVVRELPGEAVVRNGFRVQLEMSMPVFVRPRGALPNLQMARTHDANGVPAVAITNTGASRVVLSDDPNTPEHARIPNMPRYLLAGARAIRPIGANVNAIGIIFADAESTAPQQRTFELSGAPVLASHR